MKKYRFTLGVGLSNAVHDEIVEYDHDPTLEELEEDWTDWSSNYIDGGFYEVDGG